MTQIFDGYVAGVQFCNLPEKLSVGDPVNVYWEQDNKYDPHAIKVTAQGVKCGYIPRGDTKQFHVNRLSKQKIHGKITEFHPDRPAFMRLRIECWTEETAQ